MALPPRIAVGTYCHYLIIKLASCRIILKMGRTPPRSVLQCELWAKGLAVATCVVDWRARTARVGCDAVDTTGIAQLRQVFARVPDPRDLRGIRHPLAVALKLMGLAVLCGARKTSAK